MKTYLACILTPFGRLSQDIYPLIFAPLLLIVIAVHLEIANSENPYGILLGIMFTLVWMMYCIMSCRIQDCGRPGGLYLLPLFILTCWWLLALYDPSIDDNFLVGAHGHYSTLFSAFSFLRDLSGTVFPLIWIYCVLGNEKHPEADLALLARVATRSAGSSPESEAAQKKAKSAAAATPIFGKR